MINSASCRIASGPTRHMLETFTSSYMSNERIRDILRQHARLSVAIEALADDADLYAAGLTSHATVSLMVALEDHFGVEFPERMLRRRSFESIASISAAIAELTG
jgi:acyl carrier protein